jgi:putative Mn2+ efflux pump MntP
MDAFAVSIAYGIVASREKSRVYYAAPITFGLFQGAMVTIGFFIASFFTDFVSGFANFIALILLCFLGGKMIFDAVKSKGGEAPAGKSRESISEAEDTDAGVAKKQRARKQFSVLIVQGFATSIDALAIGVSMSLLSVNIVKFALLNCLITLAICAAGIIIGKRAGKILGSKAEIVGGIILIGIGVKIFVEGII